MKDPTPPALDSKKGQDRAARIRLRADYLDEKVTGYMAKAESSALRWVLARLEHVEAKLKREPTISQARAAKIIDAWLVDGVRDHNGRPVLDGLDFDDLGIG
jgi:hypothetical protein